MYRPGASLNQIATPLTMEVIDLLGASSIETFEASPQVFDAENAGALKQRLKEMTVRTGKQVISYHMPYGAAYDLSAMDETCRSDAAERIRGLLDEAAFFGAKIVVLHSSIEPIPDSARIGRITQMKKTLYSLEPSFKSLSIRAAVELLPRTCIGNTVAEVLGIVNDFDDTIGVCLDVNHFMADVDGIYSAIRALGAKLFTLHLSDYDGVDERHWLPGAAGAVIDWKKVLSALRNAGYAGPFNYECRQPDTVPAQKIKNLEKNFTDFMRPRMQE